MALALEQGKYAALHGEVPIGAVVVKNGQVIGVGHNNCIASSDPTAHAEIVAIRAAAHYLGNYRLDGCSLFVTLEPCAMCAGALLHARVARVVFAASEPKTGAAGSVVNLFESKLNHHTKVEGGVLAEQCAQMLSAFFQARRVQIGTLQVYPLRQDALRTPDERFTHLDFPWNAHYLNDLSSLAGLRMHYVDAGPPDSITVFLCVHAPDTWAYAFRQALPVLLSTGARVLVPDLIGFGKSDKPKRQSAHSLEFHRSVLHEFMDRLDLANVVVLIQGWSGNLFPHGAGGLGGRIKEVIAFAAEVGDLYAANKAGSAALSAPFPDDGHKAALKAFAYLHGFEGEGAFAGVSVQSAAEVIARTYAVR